MLIGAVGGICEVVLAGRIKESNAEADAKVEANGKSAINDEAEGGKSERDGGDGADGVPDQDRYSWQPERMTTGLSDDSTLAGSDPGASQSGVSHGEGNTAEGGDDWYGGADASQDQTSEQYEAWNGSGQPEPNSSQFVTDDVDSPGYGGADDSAQYESYPGHLNPPPAMQRETASQHQDNTGDQYWEEGRDGEPYPGSSQAEDTTSPPSDDYTGESTVAPPGAYSGEGYSPAVMPDSADYLSEYRQSQLYLQQDDDWYASAAASASYGAPAGSARQGR